MPRPVADLVATLVERASAPTAHRPPESCAKTVPVAACCELAQAATRSARSTAYAWNTPLALPATAAASPIAAAPPAGRPSSGARSRRFQARVGRRVRREPVLTRSHPGERRLEQRREQRLPAGRADVRIDRVLGVRHQPDHVAGRVAQTRDVIRRRRSG